MAVSTVKQIEQFTNISYNAISVTNGEGSIRLVRYGALRILYGSVKPSSVGSSITVGTLAAEDRPPVDIHFSLSSYSVNVGTEGKIESNGSIVLAIPANGNSNYLKFNACFIHQ